MALALLACLPAQGQVSFKKGATRIEVEIDGKPFTAFHFGTEWDKPFLHPLRAPSGVVISRGFPVEKIEGESKDHVWHRGLWFGHGDINGVNFWRELGKDKTGRVVCRSAPRARGGRQGGALSVACDLVTPQNQVIGTVRQEYRIRREGPNYLIDVDAGVVADRGMPLKMGDTEEGTLGLRLSDEFREDRGAVLSNSDRLVGTKAIWGKRARWVDYSATVKGEQVGVSMFDHPANPKHPTYWHARGYALNAANPFGEHDFLKDKTRDGSITVPKGGRLSLRYRVLIHPGSGDPGKIDEWYAAFAKGK